jgi:hypothetical protein
MGIFLENPLPSPWGGYFGGKLFIFFDLEAGCVCKIFQIKGLRAKYCKDMI